MNKPLKPQARQAAANGGFRLPQVEPVRLYRQIAALISDRIDKGYFPVGFSCQPSASSLDSLA